ncbi:MAG TPA: LuxR C-terminal-related transcriptional regulator [Solirubrobacteraceae bacterium]|nr:LuxR C-terminal-related transcriptional regulator [Solirubrobacteraceae bacterium]
MAVAHPQSLSGELVDRDRERAAIDELLDGARGESGGVLVLQGEPGLGKTALLEYAAEAATDFRSARTVGIECEMELAFAALQHLCSPFLALMERLPQPQRDALAVAFGFSAGAAPDPFLVGLAALGLLAEAAEEQPLLCFVDDAQWLDSASERALAFVARRLVAEQIVLVFATREVGEVLTGLPELQVPPLGRDHARALLQSVLPASLDDRVLERILVEARGNPLALLELPRSLTGPELAGGFGLVTAMPFATDMEDRYRQRLARLPADARRLLLVAAADPLGDPALVWRSAERLGISESAAQTVEAEDLLALTPRVVFRHPLVRSAVYGAAELSERREVHRALGESTEIELDPDHRAWHRAQAAATPDEAIAAELERSAARAQSRGGFSAAAAFLERAVALSSERSMRAQRALAAAQAKLQAGSLEDALELSEAALVEDRLRPRVHLLRAQIAFASRRGGDATPALLRAAAELEGVEPSLARETYLEAISAATFAGRLARGGGTVTASKAALAGPPMPEKPAPSDLLLHALAVRFTEGYPEGAPLVKKALKAFERETVLAPPDARCLWFASYAALWMWDDATWAALSSRHLELLRQTGELSALPFVLSNQSSVYAFMGDLEAAASVEQELKAATEATGIAPAPYGRLTIAALRGREAEFSEVAETTVRDAEARGEGSVLTVFEFLSGTLYNGLSRYDAALAAVLPAERFHTEGQAIWALTELIEAAVRCGDPERARRAFDRVQETTSAAGTDWALGIEARCRALLSEGTEASELYEEAITRLGRTSIRVQLARAHLLYGEWLRREHRHRDARKPLRTAHELFSDFEMDAFAERAQRELQATGERARKRTVDTVDELTPQETQIARLAAEGNTNREIAARLFVSQRTVEYHLQKVFRKLNVKTRTQLAHRDL